MYGGKRKSHKIERSILKLGQKFSQKIVMPKETTDYLFDPC
jgi:hypothetical protein